MGRQFQATIPGQRGHEPVRQPPHVLPRGLRGRRPHRGGAVDHLRGQPAHRPDSFATHDRHLHDRTSRTLRELCGACPIPASSGRTTGRHRLNRGGHRQANAALYRAVIVRMRFHQPTVDYVARRTAGGRTKRDIIRCLKRFLAREIYQRVMTDYRARQADIQAA